MNHDDVRAPGDVKWRQFGEGVRPTFKCPECSQNRGIFGRRMRKVTKGSQRGLRTLVCSECAK